MDELFNQATAVMKELGERAKLKSGNIVVVGCSTSEIIGSKIGTNSSPDVACVVFEAIYEYAKKQGWHLAYVSNVTRWCLDEDLDIKKCRIMMVMQLI